jgi:hypothetical protein
MNRWVAIFTLAALLPAYAQDKGKSKKPDDGGVDQKAIDKAIDKGVEFLKAKVNDPKWDQPFQRPANWPPNIPTPPPPNRQNYELVLWTFLHAGVAEKDPAFQKLLKAVVEDPLWHTYNVGLLAMILQKLDRQKYQKVIASCGQFFADTQCENGQWSYGQNYKPISSVDRKTGLSKKKKKDEDTESIPTIQIKKNPPPQGTVILKQGDNSNSQYAALGIRACHEAGVELPKETLQLAKAWWERTQTEDGSWPYTHYEPPPNMKGRFPAQKGYGSMTCGAIGALAILKSILRENIKCAPIDRAFDWLGKNFTVTDNPGHGNGGILPGGKRMVTWYFYYLYSLERAGDLTGTDRFGTHDWYVEGARELLKIQNADGSWKDPSMEGEIWSTCFAILFLKRATQPLIKTGDEKPPAKAEEPPK